MKKREPIENKVKGVVLKIAIVSAILVGAISMVLMMNIKQRAEDALLEQTEINLSNLVDSRAEIANLKLEKYKACMQDCQDAIDMLYKDSEGFKMKYIPSVAETDWSEKYILQRAIANKTINRDALKEDFALFSNLEYFLHPIMMKEGDCITGINIGFENGFILAYDDHSTSKGEPEEDGDIYFNFYERPWYQNTLKSNEIIFSDLEQDYFGRGLTLTCSAPFYKDGKPAGVIGMDILVTNLQREVIDVNVGEGSYSFIVDKNGNIVASPYVKLDTTEFENITTKENIFNDISFNILNNEKDVASCDSGYYVSHKKVDIANWILCIAVPKDLILAPVTAINKRIIITLITFVILLLAICSSVLVVAGRFSKRLVAPIVKLKNDVEVIADGNFDKKADELGDDEVTDLAKSFNNMTTSLKKYIHDLTTVTKEKERIGAELNVATQIQASMLPTNFENYASDKRFDIFASMTPAKEVGGDFYDFFMIDDTHIAIVVADVSGKGVPAALFMVIGKTLIKDHTTTGNDLGAVFSEVNNLLCEANSEELFITAFEAVIDLTNGKVTYVNAGHEMPFIYRKGKEFNAFEMKAAFVLAGMEGMNYKAGEFIMEPGDKIFQYTDGVTEATNANNELYGMDRLKNVLDANKDKKPSELLPAVKFDIDKFVGEAPQFDDITMLGFEYLSNTKG